MAFCTSYFLIILLSLCWRFSLSFYSTLREGCHYFSQRCYAQQATATATLVKNEEVDGILSTLSTNETFAEKLVWRECCSLLCSPRCFIATNSPWIIQNDHAALLWQSHCVFSFLREQIGSIEVFGTELLHDRWCKKYWYKNWSESILNVIKNNPIVWIEYAFSSNFTSLIIGASWMQENPLKNIITKSGLFLFARDKVRFSLNIGQPWY